MTVLHSSLTDHSSSIAQTAPPPPHLVKAAALRPSLYYSWFYNAFKTITRSQSPADCTQCYYPLPITSWLYTMLLPAPNHQLTVHNVITPSQSPADCTQCYYPLPITSWLYTMLFTNRSVLIPVNLEAKQWRNSDDRVHVSVEGGAEQSVIHTALTFGWPLCLVPDRGFSAPRVLASDVPAITRKSSIKLCTCAMSNAGLHPFFIISKTVYCWQVWSVAYPGVFSWGAGGGVRGKWWVWESLNESSSPRRVTVYSHRWQLCYGSGL